MAPDDLRAWTREDLERELTRLRERASITGGAGVRAEAEHVSWRVVSVLVEVLERELDAADVARRLERAGVDRAGIRDRRDWISWAEYERICGAFDAADAERVRAAGARVLQTPLLRFLGVGVSTLTDLDVALRWIARTTTGPGGLLFRGSRLEVRRRDHATRSVTFVPPPGGEVPDLFVALAEGMLLHLPPMASEPSARVRTTRLDGAVRFDIHHAPSTRLRPLRALVASLRASPIEAALDEARDALAARNDELRERIVELEESERERSALHAELDQAERMDAIGRFAGGVAHDLNNLLTVVIAQLELLARRSRGRSSSDLDAIERASARAVALCRQLLAVGGREPMRLERFDVCELVRGRRELLEAAAGETSRVRLDLPAEPAWAEADVASLERVLFDLIANAREAMPEGGELTIGVSGVELEPPPDAVSAPSGPHVALWVRDTGEGMSPDVQRRAFEPFFTTRTESGARGLGLAAAYGVARQLGGALRLVSRPGRGTEARVLLPRRGRP